MMDLDKMYAQAVAAQKSGNLPEAELRYREILTTAAIPEVMVNHANVLVGIGRRDEALAGYNRALALKPDLFEGLYNRGNLLLEMKNAEAALTSFDAALAVRQDMAGVWNNRGTALRDMRRLDAALASYDRGLTLMPGHINALTNRKTLARTSNTPGRTREINFFNLAGRLMLADLPGYGYARVPKAQVEVWTRLVNTYLRGRPSLRRACVLIDARHGIKESDIGVMKMLDAAAVSYQIVLTKADKVKAADLAKCLERTQTILRAHVAAHPHVHVTSSEKGDGIAELRAALGELAEKK